MNKLLLVVALLVPALGEAQVPAGSVSGQIRTREGTPAAAVRVSAVAVPETGVPADAGTALVSIAMTDKDGRYRLENVLPGRYYIMAGFVDLPSYYPGVASSSGATVVNVLSGTPVTGIDFTVANSVGVTVSGRVRRGTGTGAVGGQRVGLLGGTAGVLEAMTRADGSFEIPRVRPGTYQLTTAAAGRLNQRVTVVVGDQDVTGLELVIVPTVDVTGNVAIEGKGPAPRIQLQLSPFKGNGQNTSMVSTPDGSMRTQVSEGDYRVSWTNLPVGYEIKSITAGNVDLLATPLKVSVDAPPPAIRVVVSVEGNPWVKVSGRVTNPGSRRTLSLMSSSAEQIQVTVNPDGTFEIAQILPGSYQVRPDPSQPSLGPQLISVVIPNQDTTNLIIPLPATKDIPGIVVNSNGAGVQGRFTLNYSQSTGGGLRTITPQSDGKFTLEVPAGWDARVSVNAVGYSVKSLTYGMTDLTRDNMRVTATDTAEIRVVLDTISTTMSGAGAGVAVAGGVVTTSSFSTALTPLPPPPPQAGSPGLSSTAAVNRISEAVAKLNLVSSVPPVYPPLALAARVQGSVVLQAEISIEGRVQNVSVVSGHALLNEAAIQALRQWTYKPFVLNGQTIPVATTVTVDFTLP